MIARQFDHEPASAAARIGPEPTTSSLGGDGFERAHPLLCLQRAVGNRYVQRSVQRRHAVAATPAPVTAPTLRLASDGDRRERDADRVAEQVGRGHAWTSALASRGVHDTDTGGVVLPEIHRAITQVSHSEGQRIPKAVRAPLEPVMGAEFDRVRVHTSAASGNVRPGDDLAEPLVVGVVVTPDDVAADHAGLLFVGEVVGAVEGEVPQRGELRLYAV